MKFSRQQLSLAALALLLLVLLPWLVFQFESLRIKRTMEELVQAKATELDRLLGQYAVVPRLLSNHPDIVSALKNPSNEQVGLANEALLQAQSDSQSAFAFLLNTQGITVASSNYQDDLSFVNQYYGFRPYFKGALAGRETTFFAVGATTGIPGYFIANAITEGPTVIGVVVAKFDLNELPDSWRQPSFTWHALDEFGVVILSDNPELLYTPTRPLDDESLANIADDRRYLLSDAARYITKTLGRTTYIHESVEQSFFMQEKKLSAQNWTLRILHEQGRVWLRALVYLLALGALGTIAALVYRNNRAQSKLVAAEQRHAVQLEAQVEERTRELRSAQDALISESNFAMLGRMSGAINHEINQPLASLRLNLATLRSLFEQKNPDMDMLGQIVVDSDRTTKRIGRVVTTLRSLSGQRRVDKSDIDIQRLVNDVVDTLQRERPQMSQALRVQWLDGLDKHTPTIYGNDVLMTQALLNLLYNALDSVINTQQPEVTLCIEGVDSTTHSATHSATSSATDYAIECKVIDNGRGVPEEIRDNLFKPFVSDKHQTTGMGLGLTLVELIAKEHGGALRYQPIEEGGSEFVLHIPAGDFK